MTQVQQREQVIERPPEAPPRPSGLVPWIQWLGFALVLLVVGLVVWMVAPSAQVTDTDGSFQVAEAMRMEALDPLPSDGSFEAAELIRMQTLNPLPPDGSFEYAEMLRFQQIQERATG
ncbi:MAG: hypothetical protein R6X29_04925 [Acidimicrobiia bacterium]